MAQKASSAECEPGMVEVEQVQKHVRGLQTQKEKQDSEFPDSGFSLLTWLTAQLALPHY